MWATPLPSSCNSSAFIPAALPVSAHCQHAAPTPCYVPFVKSGPCAHIISRAVFQDRSAHPSSTCSVTNHSQPPEPGESSPCNCASCSIPHDRMTDAFSGGCHDGTWMFPYFYGRNSQFSVITTTGEAVFQMSCVS